MKRLEQAGLVPQKSQETATEKPLSRQGVELSVRRATLELYFYPDRPARERDQARLSRADYLTPDQSAESSELPTVVASENLLVILATRNERQRERIVLALTAGPPQPAK